MLAVINAAFAVSVVYIGNYKQSILLSL